MYRDTVTLFNRKRLAGVGRVMWYPTVLRDVDLNADRATVVARYGEQSADRAILHIKYTWSDGPTVGGKDFLTPHDWQAEPNPAEVITFQPGANGDIFIAGAWPDSAPVADDDYTDGFLQHLLDTRDGVWTVSSVSMYSLIPHFEVVGK